MLVYLDSNIVIYLVEQPLVLGPQAAARVGTLQSEGHQVAVSDLVRMECYVHPLAVGDDLALHDYERFFTSTEVKMVAMTASAYYRAAAIRAKCRFRPLDALHLAAAIEAGCGSFLTNDSRLTGFPDLRVEVLS